MPELNIDDILLLIHGEIATAVTSAEVYGKTRGIQLSSIRVRMGQRSDSLEESHGIAQGVIERDSNISLNTQRFPPAEQGWLIDVHYNPSESAPKPHKSDEGDILPSQISSFFAKTTIEKLSGVGPQYQQALNRLNIHTIQDLAELNSKSLSLTGSELTDSQIRGFQSLAHLTISISETAVPKELLNFSLRELLNLTWKQLDSTELGEIPQPILNRLSRWLQQLELCLDHDFFNQLSFDRIIND